MRRWRPPSVSRCFAKGAGFPGRCPGLVCPTWVQSHQNENKLIGNSDSNRSGNRKVRSREAGLKEAIRKGTTAGTRTSSEAG